MPDTSRRLKWVRETDLYPDGTEADSFIALDGEVEVEVVNLVPPSRRSRLPARHG